MPKKSKNIFVFASNLSGRHGKGSALEAVRKHGAIYGQGEGFQGRSYAIPTKDRELISLPLGVIEKAVSRFLGFADAHSELQFDVVAIGCGLAGFAPEQIALMFADRPLNVNLPKEFTDVLDK